MTNISRRTTIIGLGTLAASGLVPAVARSQVKDVELAVVVPLSGAWANSGKAELKGAEMAVEDVNKAGGIAALGGAKLKLNVIDAGQTPEEAKNAAQRLVAQFPNVVGGMGAFLSGMTLAVTEVTEREKLPWLTMSGADLITERGFSHVFQNQVPGSEQATRALPLFKQLAEQANGKPVSRLAIITDSTTGSLGFVDPVRKGIAAANKLEIVLDETFTPPLADAQIIAQRARRARPEVALVVTASTADLKTLLTALRQVGITPANTVMGSNSPGSLVPETLNVLSKDALNGYLCMAAVWGSEDRSIEERWRAYSGQAWMGGEPSYGYGNIWAIAQAIEKAKSADRSKVAEALRAGISGGVAHSMFRGDLKFDNRGRRTGFEPMLVQWQDGVPVPVYPDNIASAKPVQVSR